MNEVASQNVGTQVRKLSTTPGVYRLLDSKGEVLYVGKARNLRKRVQSYFQRPSVSPRIQALMQHVASVEITMTHTETEALLLENNLIKSLRPRFNILLRDDKSYPYIFVSDTQKFPRLAFHRGAQREPGRYFGPYPSAGAVRQSLNLLQKVFPVRQCEDSFFRNRSRPCLQYQIQRCSGPCVGLIGEEEYREDVRHALMFLEGRSHAVVEEMVKRMEAASSAQDYETAASYRDRIATLKRIQEKQYVSRAGGEADVLATTVVGETACTVVSFIRGGLHLGSKNFFSKAGQATTPKEVLTAFLPQYYLHYQGGSGRSIPLRLYVDQPVGDKALLERVFSQQMGKKIAILRGRHGTPRRWLTLARLNAEEALRQLQADRAGLRQRLEMLREILSLDAVPERIECFDVSHTMGEATVTACVVFDQNGAVKSDYRRFNIENIEPGDDYAALNQALTRRYRKVKEGEGKLPDLLLIDGGKGQMSEATKVLEELQIDGVRLIAVAKGRDRRPGKEQLFMPEVSHPFILPANSPALLLIQQIRDEAHRFAITGHRTRRSRARKASVLERIPGIGDKRRQALLKNFGGLQGLTRAGVEDLTQVPGISPQLARRIYDTFHAQDMD